MSISFNDTPTDVRVPLFYAEMDNSKANTAQISGASLLIGQVLADATIERNKLVLMPSADYARKLCGRGSQLARMVDAYRKTDPFGELYVVAVANGVGGSMATGEVKISGTVTAAGAISLYIGSKRVQGVVSADDTALEAAQALADAINADPDLPVKATAKAVSGNVPVTGVTIGTKVESVEAAAAPTGAVVTLTAKYAGESANGLPLALNYYGTVGGEQTPDGLNVTLTAMSDGAGSVDLAPVIAAMGDEAFDYIGFPFNDSNSLKMIGEEMNDSAGRWSWARQVYGHVYTAKIGTLTDLVAFGDTFNDQHLTVCGYEEGTQSPIEELIAARLGRQASFLRIDPARPTQTGEITGALPALVGSRFSVPERQSLLTHGIATASVVNGVMQIERDITTYKANKLGVTDNSYLDSETLHTSAYVIRKLKSVITSKYPRHKLANDGTRFGPGQAIVTPSVIKGEICAAYRQMEIDGIVENFDVFKAHLIVERSTTDTNRLNVLFPPDYVNQLRVFAMLNQFRLQYSDEEINANG